jgi:TRAP-type C4-dicarboxylate transport system substrate-binding protein
MAVIKEPKVLLLDEHTAALDPKSAAQVIKLNLADQNPATGWGPVHALQPWAKKVEEVTKGRVKIDIYPAQTLVKGPDIWNAVKTGVVDAVGASTTIGRA